MDSQDHESLVRSWLTIQRHWWAHEALDGLCRDDPERAWPVILALVAEADTDELLSVVAAGPLEDLLDSHPAGFIERVEAQASNVQFRKALANVWLSEHEQSLLQRYLALGCQLVATGN